MHGTSLPLIILGVINILLGIVVWLRDRARLSNSSFLGLVFSVGVWCIGIAAFYTTRDAKVALDWTRLYYAAPVSLVSFLVLFAMSFPDKNISLRRVILILLPFLLFAVAISINPHLIVQSISQLGDTKNVTLRMAPYTVYCIFIVSYFSLGLGALAYKRDRIGQHRKQITFFLVGSIIPAVLGVVFNLVLPFFGNYRLIWAGPLATTMFAFFVGMNIVINKMFDIRTFVIRALAYSLTALVLAVVYIAPLVFIIMLIIGATFSWPSFILATIISTIVAIYYHRLKKWFDKQTNRIFFRDVYEPSLLLGQLNKALVETIDINRLLSSASDILNDAFNPEFCVSMIQGNEEGEIFNAQLGKVPREFDVVVLERALKSVKRKTIHYDFLPATANAARQQLELMNVQVLTKMTVVDTNNRQAQGYVLLGPRKSGLPYGRRDLEVLDTVGNTLTIALQNALRFEEIRDFNKTLQQRIDGATHKLQLSNEKLKKLDETKDDFVSMASHQLRTPLTSVKGYLSMVLEGDGGEVNDTQREMLMQSYTSAQRMVYLISDLLNLSRINTGKFVIDATPVDLRDIAAAELSQLGETAKARDITLTYEPPESFPLLMLDETKIHQVVMNFVDNAIYYTPPGGTIVLSLHETATAVELRVKDSGIGVPRDLQRHLFTKFYRADNARRMRPDGTGLGLFMSKKVIIAQNGAVLFESEEGKGSMFGFRFNKASHSVPEQQNTSLES